MHPAAFQVAVTYGFLYNDIMYNGMIMIINIFHTHYIVLEAEN